jgi:hypothetical protein
LENSQDKHYLLLLCALLPGMLFLLSRFPDKVTTVKEGIWGSPHEPAPQRLSLEGLEAQEQDGLAVICKDWEGVIPGQVKCQGHVSSKCHSSK